MRKNATPNGGALRPRTFAFDAEMRTKYPSSKQFLAPQRDHVRQPMPVRVAAVAEGQKS